MTRYVNTVGVSYLAVDEPKSAKVENNKLSILYSTNKHEYNMGYLAEYIESSPYIIDSGSLCSELHLDHYTNKIIVAGEKNQYLLNFLKEQNISNAIMLRDSSFFSSDYITAPPIDSEWNAISGSAINVIIMKEKRVNFDILSRDVVSKTEVKSPYSLYFIKKSDCLNCYDYYLVNNVNPTELYVVKLPPIPAFKTVSSASPLKIFIFPFTIALDIVTSPIQFYLGLVDLSKAH